MGKVLQFLTKEQLEKVEILKDTHTHHLGMMITTMSGGWNFNRAGMLFTKRDLFLVRSEFERRNHDSQNTEIP